MPEPNTGEEAAQEEIATTGEGEQTQEVIDPTEEVEIDGFDNEPPEEETPPADEEEEEVVEEEPESVPPEKVKELEAHIRDLNKALHIERQKRKEQAKEEAEPLTEQQLRELMKEHADDPDTMFNIINYMMEQKTKNAGKEAIDATTLAAQKAQHDQIIANQWPDLLQEDSQLRQTADSVKQEFRIENHPMGDLLAMGILLQNSLPKMQQEAYEKGKAEGLKGRVEQTRKKGIKETALTPSGKPRTGGKPRLDGQLAATAKQIGLTDSQKKIYARLVANKNVEVE